MISLLRGPVVAVRASALVIDVGGVGFSVSVTPTQALQASHGAEITLHTTLIVREDDLSLVGFGTESELQVFDLLRGVSGVGPKSALGVLSALSPDQIALAVANEDDAVFRKVSGIGPKTAKLIILQLTGKMLAPAKTPELPKKSPVRESVLQALIGLGWNERTAEEALDRVSSEGTQANSEGTLLRAALAELGPKR
ncbi:Holliday junction branch migration protein RuvA [Humidisolicoccus flavus]|uniref:Holliday junction branch migration protein RuvA n=1 Tax=Humidisolicoccus flavus TaxID=3111414 RepID=UPI0032460934